MSTNKQLALAVNKNLKSKAVGIGRWAIFDGEQQVAPDCYSPQTAWSNARMAVCCPFPVGSKVKDDKTGHVYTIRASTFGYPHIYENEKGLSEGMVCRLFEYSDSERFKAIEDVEPLNNAELESIIGTDDNVIWWVDEVPFYGEGGV